MDSLTVSVKEAGARTGIGRDSVYKLVAEGRLGHVKIGRRIRIPTAELERFLEREASRKP